MCAIAPALSVWADPRSEQIKPRHVYVQAQVIQNNIAFLREEMGKTSSKPLKIRITNAQPREVYFQALTLYGKTDRLCFDHTGNIGPIPPKMKRGKIIPGDVLEVLKKATTRLNCVSDRWGIKKTLKEPLVNPDIVPSDVYMKILEINRELNFLLDIPYSPTTVYRRIRETVQLLESILQRKFPDLKLPESPQFISGKQPRDVYLQNLKCMIILQQISRILKIQIIDFHFEDEKLQIFPGDVYDLASLLLSKLKDLENVYNPNSQEETVKGTAFSQRKLPSHVFQKAVYLERLLLNWKIELEKEPDNKFEQK